MSTKFIHSVVCICPEQLMDQANHLFAAAGRSVADLDSFTGCNYTDDADNGYCVVRGSFTEDMLQRLQNDRGRPSFDSGNAVDLAKVLQARGLLEWNLDSVSNKISCSLTGSIQSVAAEAGLTIIPMEEV